MKVEINCNLLVWAREEAHLTPFDIATRMGKTEEEIESWESGSDFPTYNQLERLAYEILKKPVALFFFPEPPILGDIQKSFRTLPEVLYKSIPNKVIRLINEARAMQINLSELNDGVNPAKNNINSISAGPSYIETAKMMREIMDSNLREQKSIKKIDKAFEYWRKKLADLGIYVFKEAFKSEDYSGFCIHDQKFPVIYVNNSMSFSRQIFTLFHELYHLMCGTSGIDTINDDYIYNFDNLVKDIEVTCNAFAGEFLVPTKDFKITAKLSKVNDETIEKLANLYCVSREVILRKFLDIGKISSSTYELKSSEYRKEAVRVINGKDKSGGDYYNTKITYLGMPYINLVYEKYNLKKFDKYQLADYLRIKYDGISSIERRFFERGV